MSAFDHPRMIWPNQVGLFEKLLWPVMDVFSLRRKYRYQIYFLAIVLPFLALVIYQIQISYHRAKDSASTNAKNLSLVIESRIARDFEAAEHVVATMAREIDPKAMNIGYAEKFRPKVTAWLKSYVYAVSSASALRYFDVHGDRLYTSYAGESAVNISDRLFFRKLKQNPSASIVYSEVLVGRYTGRASMYIAKSVVDADGLFLGVAVTAIDLTAIQDDFKKLFVGHRGVIALRRLDDGALVVDYPSSGVSDNKPFLASPARVAILGDDLTGSMEMISPVDGVKRIYGYRPIGYMPFFVVVGLADAYYLKEWYGDVLMIGGCSLLFVAILSMIFFALARSERRRSESEADLRLSEERFRLLIQKNHAVILQIDPASGQITDANGAACHFYGWTHQELCSKRIDEINTLSPELIKQERLLALEEKRNYFIFPHRLANGDTRTVEVHSTPLNMNDRAMLVSIVHDVTDRVRDEVQIEKLLAEQKAIIDSDLVGIVKVSYRHIVWVNTAFARMLGYKSHELIGRPIRILHPTEEASLAFSASVKEQVARNAYFRTTAQLLRKDGGLSWFDINVGPITPGVIHESIGALVDVNARMNFESALIESEERFRIIADYTYDWEYWQGVHGDMMYVSPACERVSGYAQADFYAHPDLLGSIIHQEDKKLYDDHKQHLLTVPESDVIFRIIRKDGEVRWIAHGCRKVVTDDGRYLGLRSNDRDITDLKKAEQRARELAFFDQLTGLPNRRMLMDRLEQGLSQAKRFHRAMAVMFIDLDRFKQVNDRLGHEAGDDLLKEVARRLAGCVRAADTVARSGGDEFVVVLTEIQNPNDAILVAAKILQIIQIPVCLVGQMVDVSMSIGIALYPEGGQDDANALMRKADTAMYAIKGSGRNGYRVFEAG
ncbi:diguanylate cyclase domain-containing protein [Leptothrix ochracea]|uniref:sensor domain-containing diguanylate cyclase n=1 Tax=Leptothrix ochracea TaxID=735331 RepID=UPI0034E2B36E